MALLCFQMMMTPWAHGILHAEPAMNAMQSCAASAEGEYAMMCDFLHRCVRCSGTLQAVCGSGGCTCGHSAELSMIKRGTFGARGIECMHLLPLLSLSCCRAARVMLVLAQQ
jgi:hypothetical protein